MEKTKLIAHRGLSALYYQNTLQAFEEAAKSGVFQAIETDIWLTTDGVWVCSHDRDPFSDPTLLVDCVTYEQASSTPLNANKSRGAKMEGDVFICTFEDYLNVCAQYGLTAIIELKSALTKEQAMDMLEITKAKLPPENFVIISFIKENIDIILSLDKDVNTMVLTSHYFQAKSLLSAGYNIAVHNWIATPNLIQRTKQKGKKINVWTVNTARRANSLIKAGVDYLTTDCILPL